MSEIDRCLAALALELPEAVHADVVRIVTAELTRLREEIDRLTREEVRLREQLAAREGELEAAKRTA